MKWAWIASYGFALHGTFVILDCLAEVEEGHVIEGRHALIAGAVLVGMSSLLLHSSIECHSGRRIRILLLSLYPAMFLIPMVIERNRGAVNSLIAEIAIVLGFSLLFPLCILARSEGDSKSAGKHKE